MKNKFIHNFNNNSFANNNKTFPLLMRDYINNKLYFENEAYYSNTSKESLYREHLPIGRLEQPLNFTTMRGISDYAKELNMKYPKSTWLTCSELLRPYFGYAVGNYILTQHFKTTQNNQTSTTSKSRDNSGNIKIVEIGCGMGGAIDSILEYLKNFSIKEYKQVEYYGLEMTQSLCEHTENLLKKNHPDLYRNNQIKLINKSIYEYNKDNVIDDECFILAFNLIDSLGHDKVKFERGFDRTFLNELKEFYKDKDISALNRKGEDFKEFLYNFLNKNKSLFKQTVIQQDNNADTKLRQVYQPVEDDTIKELLFYYLLPAEEKAYILGEEFFRLEKRRLKQYEEWFVRVLRVLYNWSISSSNVWLPTESIKLFKTIDTIFPNHNLVLLDFDFLPSKLLKSDYKGKNAPAVYSIIPNSYDSITHPSIFTSYETINKPVNVYFPVDFELLQMVYNLTTGKTSSVNKFKYFMHEFSMSEWCETQSGFNPLTDTHNNLSFLLTLK